MTRCLSTQVFQVIHPPAVGSVITSPLMLSQIPFLCLDV
jgi:hypothetical protein